MLVEDVAEKGYDAVDGDEEEDADDVSLLVGFEVVGRVREDEEEADACCDQGEDAAEEETKVVEGDAIPQRFFVDELLR